MGFADIFLQFVCPTMGSILSSVMFAAPVQDLRQALIDGRLECLNPFPWIFCTGNCLGWVVYGYYTRDPFVVAANLPGLVLSIWLNSGASKLQYLELVNNQKQQQQSEIYDASPTFFGIIDHGMDRTRQDAAAEAAFVMVPQERALLRVLTIWSVVIVYVGWFSRGNPATTVGIVVNMNLIFFYGAPLQTIQTVITTKNSSSIHVPTMIMNWCNTSFWILYGIARKDAVIVLPNSIGLLMGLMQGVLRLRYPASGNRTLVATTEPNDDHLRPNSNNNDGEGGLSSPPEIQLPVDNGTTGSESQELPVRRR